MDTKVPEVLNCAEAVPQIVITEPSPLIQNNSAVSVAEKAEPTTPHDTPVDIAHSVQIEETLTKVTESEANSGGEFTSAQECNECVVSIPEPESQSIEDPTIAASEVDHDDFRTASSTVCCPIGLACLLGYERIWEKLDNRCRLPFWLILMTIPLSSGVMGSLYMFSCPAARTLPSAIFTIGISLLAVLTIRVCIILHRITCTEEEDSRRALHTLLLIATFVTVVFFITESVIFWQMDSTSYPGTDKFCDPTFVNYTFWWNCIMWVMMVPLSIFPA